MGITKSDYFNEKQNDLAKMFKALAHLARIAIVEHLIAVNSCICADIVNELPLAQPTISQHLKELKSAGLIMGNIEGNNICYCINQLKINEVKLFLDAINDSTLLKQDNCC